MSTRIDNAQPHRPIAATVDADSDLYLHLSGADFCRTDLVGVSDRARLLFAISSSAVAS